MKLHFASLAVGSMALSACIVPSAYIDPKYSSLSIQDVTPVQQDVALDVQFFRDGKLHKAATKLLRGEVASSLEKFGYTVVDDNQSTPKFTVSFNNVLEDDAFAKGFGTGLTFGLVGTAVTDAYEITVGLSKDGETIERTYGHAIHTTVGNTAAPVDTPKSKNPSAAFSGVVEDVMIQFMLDNQSSDKGEPVAVLILRPRFQG